MQCICRLQCMTSLWCAAYSPGERQLILTLKVETRHPVGGPFGCAFSGICNHCGVMTAWNRKIWIFFSNFCVIFLKKNDLLWYNFPILLQKFTWRHRLMLLCLNVVKFVRREIDEIVRYLPHQKEFRLPLKLSQLRVSRPKSTRASRPQHLVHNVLNFIQIGLH